MALDQTLRINASTPIGTELEPVKKRALIQLMGSRLWGRFNPNHWDPEYALSTGLSAPIQTGEMNSAYIAEMCVNHFGEHLFQNARVVCKYIASTLADEIITTHGIVTEKKTVEEGCRIKVDVWCDNELGEKKTVGWVEVTLPN
jgi:acyl dehydratase